MGAASGETGSRKGSGREPRARERAAVVAIPIDAVADAAIAARAELPSTPRCSVCDAAVRDDSGSRGLMVWSRGDEVRYEEPHLCESCGTVLGMLALAEWQREEEDEE